MRIKEIRAFVGNSKSLGSHYIRIDVILDDGQFVSFTQDSISNPDSTKNWLCHLLTGETAIEFWERNTWPVVGTPISGELVYNPKKPIKIFVQGIDL